MAKKKRERSTSRMPSGAQQYVRGENSIDRQITLQDRINANRGRNPELERRLIDAIKDEDPSARYGDSGNKGSMLLAEPGLPKVSYPEGALRRGDPNFQGRMEPNRRPRGFENGGMVRGTRPVQVSGKNFSGNF